MQENNPIQSPIPPVVAPQVAVEQPKQSNFLVILLSVLLFLSVSIAGFFAFQTQKLVKELTMLKTEPTSEVTAEPVATDPSAGWQTYTNSDIVVSDYSTFVEKSKNSQGSILISNSIYYNTTLENCGSLPIIKNCFVESSSWGQQETIKNIILDGKQAISYFVNDSMINEPVHVIETVVTPKIQIAQVVGGAGLEESFSQFISTFKFTN